LPLDKHQRPDAVFRAVRNALLRGARVDIDGLGSFLPDAAGGFSFQGLALPKVFITYVHEDAAGAERLYNRLARSGFDPWLAPEAWRFLEPKKLPAKLASLKYPDSSCYQIGILRLQVPASIRMVISP